MVKQLDNERLALIAMTGATVAMFCNRIPNTIVEPDSPNVANACVLFALGYEFPLDLNGNIKTDEVHNDIFDWVAKYMQSIH